MTAQIKKLLSLNLALLLIVMTAIPVIAAGDEQTYLATESGTYERDLLLEKGQEQEESVMLLDEGDPYYIWVNGTRFRSDSNASGTNWTYEAETNCLTLNNYTGSSIRASGDLTIYTVGTVSVTGASGTNYGSDGIEVDGSLLLAILSGSLSVTGGAGNRQGGDAVAVHGVLSCVCLAEATFTGGQTYNSAYNGDLLMGGDALYASSLIELYGEGITAVGGSGNTSSPGSGGCALLSNWIYVYADCTLKGGAGYYSGPAIYFGSYCRFDLINASIQSGSGSVRLDAIVSSDDLSWYRHNHTTAYGTVTSIRIEINEYTLTLWGMGGLIANRATFTSLTDYYPAEYQLANYLFERDGYVQVAWRTTGGSLLPLNTVYCPSRDTRLMAEWIDVQNGDIVLNGNGGKTEDGYLYNNYGSTTVILPEVTYTEDVLLGWCTEIVPKENQDLQYPGQWYTSGYTIGSDDTCVQALYAQAESTGQYAVFHPGEGAVTDGGNILVYGTLSTTPNLQVTAPDATQITAPKYYELAGWSSEAQADTVEYEPGDTIALEVGETQQFYAQWKPAYYEVIQDEIRFTVAPVIGEVQVTVPGTLSDASEISWCMVALYNGDGKMLSCDVTSYQTGSDSELMVSGSKDTATVCKVFFLGEDRQPVRETVVFELTDNS